jgi:hypothetical protein
MLEQLPMPDPYLVSVVPAFTFDQLAADRLAPQNLLDRVAAGQRSDSWSKRLLIQTQDCPDVVAGGPQHPRQVVCRVVTGKHGDIGVWGVTAL